MDRAERLHVFLSADEKRMLKELADRRGVTTSTQIRLMVRDFYDANGRKQSEDRPSR